MARKPRKVHEKREVLELGDLKIPVRIITEAGRYNTRASVTSQALIIRLPQQLGSAERASSLKSMVDWARETVAASPEAFVRFKKVKLSGRYHFRLRDELYAINVRAHELQHHKVLAVGEGELEILVNTGDSRLENGKLLPALLAKHFGRICLPAVAHRVRALNDQHFGRPINDIKLSDTYSRWGSCSSKGNINLATRLVLAPDEIMDAVIIHELAHLVEANHSSRFWAEVARALPNYREYDEWLRIHGKSLLFKPEAV